MTSPIDSIKSACLLTLCLLLGFGKSTNATQDPIPPPPQVETLRVIKQISVTGTRLSWTDGTGPYVGVRSQTPNFLNSPTLFYVSRGIAASPLDDPNTLSDANSYFYQLNDVNTYPEVYTDTSLTDYVVGVAVTLDGANFSPGSTHVYIEGIEVPTISVSSSQIQFNVPASVPSGNIIVQCASGLTTTRKISVVYFKNHEDMTHVAVDSNHDAWVTERGISATADKIYKITHLTGVVQTFTSLNESVGLPKDASNNLYVANSLNSASNIGTVRQITPAGVNTPWSAAGSGTDPLYARALGIDPRNNATAGLNVYFLDGNNNQIRKVSTVSKSTYRSGLGIVPNPGGLDMDLAGNLFYTNDSSTIQEINTDTQASVFTFGASLGINLPAQIHVENNRRIWVANRGDNNLLRISTDPTELPGPASRKVIAKYSGLTSPRGIAVDHDPAIDPATGLSYTWAYVAEQTKFSRFRVYDTVWVNINILNEAINNPTTGIAEVSLSVLTAKAQSDFDEAREIFKQVGIDLRLRGINYIADPNNLVHNPLSPTTVSPRPGWLSMTNTATLTGEQTTLFGTGRSANTRDINIYYILAMWDISAPGVRPLNGITYTNDYIAGMNNLTQSAIVITRYNQVISGQYQLRKTRTTMAHEIAHFLLDNFAGTFPAEHSAPNLPFLMAIQGNDAYVLTSAEISNIQNNSDESAFIDRF